MDAYWWPTAIFFALLPFIVAPPLLFIQRLLIRRHLAAMPAAHPSENRQSNYPSGPSHTHA